MFDEDTLVVTYDAERGEPRGACNKTTDTKGAGLGSCVDCNICVQVCPTGIDIRKGLQYECIGCGACIDACDEVMDKMAYPRGLVRYFTEHALQQKLTPKQMWARVRRPRILIYTVVLSLIVTAWATVLWHRNPLKIDIIRDRAVMAREVAGGKLENIYQLRVMNTSEQAHRYHVEAQGLDGAVIAVHEDFDVPAATTRTFAIGVGVKPEGKTGGTHRVDLVVTAQDGSERDREHAVFYIPEY
jgi:cytochrome c oxidase accessory protein FixG